MDNVTRLQSKVNFDGRGYFLFSDEKNSIHDSQNILVLALQNQKSRNYDCLQQQKNNFLKTDFHRSNYCSNAIFYCRAINQVYTSCLQVSKTCILAFFFSLSVPHHSPIVISTHVHSTIPHALPRLSNHPLTNFIKIIKPSHSRYSQARAYTFRI